MAQANHETSPKLATHFTGYKNSPFPATDIDIFVSVRKATLAYSLACRENRLQIFKKTPCRSRPNAKPDGPKVVRSAGVPIRSRNWFDCYWVKAFHHSFHCLFGTWCDLTDLKNFPLWGSIGYRESFWKPLVVIQCTYFAYQLINDMVGQWCFDTTKTLIQLCWLLAVFCLSIFHLEDF